MNRLSELITVGNKEFELEDKADYVGADGLVYCGKCRTAKQYRPSWAPDEVHNCLCECQEKKIQQEEEREAVRQKARRLHKLRGASLMDAKFCESTFANFRINKQNERPYGFCRRYAECFDEMMKNNQGLLLYGGVGTGKTYLAACIANFLLDQGVSVVMTSFVRILQDMQGLNTGWDEQQFMRKLNNVKLLVLDDLGAERSTDYALEKVYGIVDARYRARKPLILTTNLALAHMQSVTDIRYARIYDRVFEICYPIEFKGQSLRRDAARIRFDKMTEFLGR